MRRVILFFALVLPVFFFSASGPFHVSSLGGFPDEWMGDTSLFVFHPDEAVIQLFAPEEAGEAFLFTKSTAFENAGWEIGVTLEFNPSASNYLQIYLATDGKEQFHNGFYLIAGTTKDNISLWQRIDGEDELLIEGEEDRLDNSPATVNINVVRGKGGQWHLKSDVGDGWQIEGEAHSSFGFAANYFGMSCHYTKTRSRRFFIGPVSVSGEVYRDTVAPQITDVNVLNGHSLNVMFSEPVISCGQGMPEIVINSAEAAIKEMIYSEDESSVEVFFENALPDIEGGEILFGDWCDMSHNALKDTTLAFSYFAPKVSDINAESHDEIMVCFDRTIPDTLVLPEIFLFHDGMHEVREIEAVSNSCYRLYLKNGIRDGVETALTIESLILPDGDTIPSGPYFLYYHEAGFGDLVITEIMHDPSPAAELPGVEYVELYNRSTLPVDLKNMSLDVNDNQNTLPEYLLFSGEYVVLLRKGAVTFSNRLELDKWHALTNSGGEIVLRNASGDAVAAFRYPGTISGKGYKQQGGWAYEIIDTENISGHIHNWAYCQNETGGTPGLSNSVKGPNPDLFCPQLTDAWLENDSMLVVDFAEPLTDDVDISKAVDIKGSIVQIDTVVLDPVFRNVVSVRFQKPLIPHSVETLTLSSDLTDMAGNNFSGPFSMPFGRPGKIDSFDLVINELLFDPPPYGGDYVELFNRSTRIASLDSLCLSRAGDDGFPEKLISLSARTRWFLPGWHLCFAASPEWVKEQFNDIDYEKLRALFNLPNYINDGGTVFLTYRNGAVIDQFKYAPQQHFALLSESKMVALERTSPDSPTNRPGTWHSASGTVNYGTPTGANSQLVEPHISDKKPLFSLSPEIFTPDMDGTDDLLTIAYAFESNGNKGTFIVYDADGRRVKQLVNNQLLGTSGQISWDGTNNNRHVLPPGIYIVWGRIFDLNGHVREYKESCVLGTR
jgi:hypothetical protein